MLFLSWWWPVCLTTTAFNHDQNQRKKLTCLPAPASFIPYLHTPCGMAASDENPTNIVGGFEVQIPVGEVKRLQDKVWHRHLRKGGGEASGVELAAESQGAMRSCDL